MLRKVKSGFRGQGSGVGKEIFLCLLSAVLLVLSFPRSNYWILAWFGFVPLFFAIKGKSRSKAFLLSYLTGAIFWLGTIYWLMHVTLAGMIVLALYLALYFGLFGLFFATFCHLPSVIYLLPSIWVSLEYLRSHLLTGFPWALLGYSQYLNLPAIQIADITGVWGVSFLVMMANVAVYQVCGFAGLRVCGWSSIEKKVILPFLLLLLSLGYGFYIITRTPAHPHTGLPIRVSVIQGNIPQELKWDPVSKDFIMNRYFNLTQKAAEEDPDMIIWPEAAVPVVLEEEPVYYEKVKAFVRRIKKPLLFGAVNMRDDFYYNSALLLSRDGDLLTRYDKLHLVPFGEYIPLRKILPFLQVVVPIGDFAPGKEHKIFYLEKKTDMLAGERVNELAGSSRKPANQRTRKPANQQAGFSVLICFEDLFPELSREFVKRGADFLVNITNDAWFKNTSSPYQHLQASVFRAVENRRNLVRAANTGISGFINPQGKIISLVQDANGSNAFVEGYDTQQLLVSEKGLSFYTRYGDVFIIGCFLFILYVIISGRKVKSEKRKVKA